MSENKDILISDNLICILIKEMVKTIQELKVENLYKLSTKEIREKLGIIHESRR